METLPQNLIDEINGLSGLKGEDLRRRYPDLLMDIQQCRSAGILRQIIAYRLQEKYYGICLSKECQAWMAQDSPGTRIGVRGKPIGSGARLIRYWKGERFEVLVRDDGTFELGGKFYKSLSAVARAITGTQWNGKIFFGVK